MSHTMCGAVSYSLLRMGAGGPVPYILISVCY